MEITHAKRFAIDNMGARFKMNGNPSHRLDNQRADAARLTVEPDWKQLSLIDLIAAERMAQHRVSGGEVKFERVLKRIRNVRHLKQHGHIK